MCEISVAMSVYNGEKNLEESIESILNQSFTNFELIICDDYSTDCSLEIIKKYMEKDNRIILIENNSNMGLSASLNKCIFKAKGKYIARMDADDISIQDRFQKQYDFLEENRDIAFVSGNSYLFDEQKVWGEYVVDNDLTLETVYKYQPIIHPTVIMRREVIKSVGGYTVAPYTVRGQDFDLWCKMYFHGYKGKNINEMVLYYRNDESAYERRKFKYRIDSYLMKKKWRKKLKLPFWYNIYAYKPLIAGLIPNTIMKKYHSRKFK